MLEKSAHQEQANGSLTVLFDTGSSTHRRFCGSMVKASTRAACSATSLNALNFELRCKTHEHMVLELTVDASCSRLRKVSLEVCMAY